MISESNGQDGWGSTSAINCFYLALQCMYLKHDDLGQSGAACYRLPTLRRLTAGAGKDADSNTTKLSFLN